MPRDVRPSDPTNIGVIHKSFTSVLIGHELNALVLVAYRSR